MTADQDLRRGATRLVPHTEDAGDRSGLAVATVDRRGSFRREKFLWLEQVRADPALTPLAFMLAYVLADFVNEREGCAWPSIARLAAECRVTERGVQKVIRRLVERGHLTVELGNGRGETNRYRWIVQGEQRERRIEHAKEAIRPSVCSNDERRISKDLTSVHPIQSERVNRGSEKGEQRFKKGRTSVHPTLVKESIYDLLYRLSSGENAQGPPTGFDDFWQAYPKKVGRSDAIRAFAAAVRLATPDEITRSATRYAADRRGEDPRYTKNPATWLSKACWNDPSPPLRAFPWDDPRQSNPFDRSIVAQLHDDNDFEEALTRLQQQRNKRV